MRNSNQAVPSEYAVKTYVDTKTAAVGATLNKIFGAASIAGNSTQALPAQPYRVSLVTGSGDLTWTLSGAPSGLSVTGSGYTATISSSGAITAGSYAMTLTAASGTVTLTQAISLVTDGGADSRSALAAGHRTPARDGRLNPGHRQCPGWRDWRAPRAPVFRCR